MKPVATFDPLLSLWNCDSYDTGGTLASAPATLGEELERFAYDVVAKTVTIKDDDEKPISRQVN